MVSLDEAHAKGLVIGLAGESGIQYRREIDDLAVNDPDVLNLILLALERLQTDEGGYKKQDKMGYFQIAGRSWAVLVYHHIHMLICQAFMVSQQ